MTNLLNLPQLPAGTIINIESNADWLDQFYVPAVGYEASQEIVVGNLSSSTFTPLASANFIPGMLAAGPGLPSSTTITGVSGGVATLSNAAPSPLNGVGLTFTPPPLDLTGIIFRSKVRPSLSSSQVILSVGTDIGGMVNGGALGTFGWSVPAAQIAAAPWGAQLANLGEVTCSLDVIATDATGAIVNLCAQNGPIILNVLLGLTR